MRSLSDGRDKLAVTASLQISKARNLHNWFRAFLSLLFRFHPHYGNRVFMNTRHLPPLPSYIAFLIVFVLACAGRPKVAAALSPEANSPAKSKKLGHAMHSPLAPKPNESVDIRVRAEGSITSVSLELQEVEPGNYISLHDAAFKTRWRTLPMTLEAASAPPRFQVRVPPTVQTQRKLVRYRFRWTDDRGASGLYPTGDAPEPNFAYFVYSGIPAWTAAINPKSAVDAEAEKVLYPPAIMSQVQSYQLIASKRDIEKATWTEPTYGKEYRHTGTLVSQGEVYDHVGFRARGGGWRHSMGKNMWKLSFNQGHRFQAIDDYGRPYKTKWSKLNLGACIQQGDYGRRGEQGMYEAVGFRLFNLAGVEAPLTHWISLRVVSEAAEDSGDQYKGDFWGLYLAVENEDGRFLKEHGLPDGNLYKMGGGEIANLGAGQPTNHSDLIAFGTFLRTPSPVGTIRAQLDLPNYYSYRAIVEAIHHYDIGGGKNYDFYRNPSTGQWRTVPWDIDLTWGDHMFGDGRDPLYRLLYTNPELVIEYQNRLREIRDLLFNADETGRLIDECAAIVSRRKGEPSIVAADRAKWDYHPVMVSSKVMAGKTGHGMFYTAASTRDFAGMVQMMKDYVATRSSHLDRLASNIPTAAGSRRARGGQPRIQAELALPGTPKITQTSEAHREFRVSPFEGEAGFAALEWRVGEVAPAVFEKRKPVRRGIYEITPVWTSPVLNQFQENIRIPAEVFQGGKTYRVRARFKDASGRWGHWSAPETIRVPSPTATPN